MNDTSLKTEILSKLQCEADNLTHEHMKDWFEEEQDRAEKFKIEACGISLDYSKNIVHSDTVKLLIELAELSGLQQRRDEMFKGVKINNTEERAVLHTALRDALHAPLILDNTDIKFEISSTLSRLKKYVEGVHSGVINGMAGERFTDVVSLGIGGSYLGPKIMTEALKPYQVENMKLHFIANVDGSHIHDVLKKLNPSTTLFIVSSKSFSTQETLQNTLTAKEWFLGSGASQNDIANHFVAVSSNIAAAQNFGIDKDNIFPMWDWVGGRYSLWSALGLPIALAIGYQHFEELLDGAFEMDKHFKDAPLNQNLPVILGLLGVWYRNFFDAQSHAILPYYHYLRGLPAYIQQLDMESNGKSCDRSGKKVDYETGPIIWGSEGTNGQHSFHQHIHQSNTLIPVDFILPIKAPSSDTVHHTMLAANCFGQSQALMQGYTYEQCLSDLQDLPEEKRKLLAAHKTMPGNKPSNTLLLQELTPKILGSLIAMYEHKVFVQGIIWDVNSFDQWGVELGKKLGDNVLEILNGARSFEGVDSSTASLIRQFLG